MANRTLVSAIASAARPLKEGPSAWEPVLETIGDARIVLLGEATHGTHEFYNARAQITRRLIVEKNFDAVVVEADWPDSLRASRYAQAATQDADANSALGGFERFPRWMWRNADVLAFIEWVKRENDSRAPEERVGFFGLDLYSLRASMDAVVRYLATVDPDAEQRARARYGCFDHIVEDPQRYGYAITFGLIEHCEREALHQLVELTHNAERFLRAEGVAATDELFYVQQNARVAVNAERYYRSMFRGRNESWNRRDTHMAETLHELDEHLSGRRGRPARIVVWAHNSHLGDARVTEMGESGELNLGQLVRERYGPAHSRLVGFTTHRGTVTAASEWDAPAELKHVRDSHPDSFERLFHETGITRFLLISSEAPALRGERHLEREIGVIYLPQSERVSHYFYADLARQFDAVIHVDETRALVPLDPSDLWKHSDLPEEMETYPSGI